MNADEWPKQPEPPDDEARLTDAGDVEWTAGEFVWVAGTTPDDAGASSVTADGSGNDSGPLEQK